MTASGRAYAVAAAAFLFTLLPGCKQVLGLNERTEGLQNTDGGNVVIKPVPGVCGGLLHASDACAACMDANCCDLATACGQDPTCDPAYDCNTSCGDDGTCRARCNTFFTRSDSFVEVSACRETQCRAQCGLSCGGLSYAAPGCDQCVKEKATCCQTVAKCVGNADCVKLDLCRTNCIAGSMSCPTDCERMYSGGIDDLAPTLDCISNQCVEVCQPGRNWSCLDTRTPWLKPKSAGDVTITVTIADIYYETPFVGSKVKACRKADRDCTTPLQEVVSGPDGLVTLTIPLGAVGFDGYLDITGGNNGMGGQAGQIYPAIWYPMPPIVSAGWRGRIQFVSYGSLDLLALLTGAKIDPMRGHFAANAQDCNFASASGVSFESDKADGNTTPFYFIGGVPKTDAKETDPLSGIGGFINLPAGQLTLITPSLMINGEKKTLGSPAYIIRPGSFTTTSIPPIP
jgi:hypothetical protein